MSVFLRYTIGLLLFLLLGIGTYAQKSSCAFKLQEAESLYETGNLDSIPRMLRSCINKKEFDQEELSRAYKLLILTYQFQDYQEMAELTMQKFLKDFPEYEIKPTDPVEFTYLYSSYKTIPTISLGIIGGLNYSMARIIEPYPIAGKENTYGKYSTNIKYQFGIQLKKYITDEIDLNLDVIYSFQTIDYTITQLDYTTSYTENQNVLSFPLTGTYDFKFMGLDPYVRLGFSVDYLLNATADFTKVNNMFNTEDVKESGYDIMDDRNTFNISGVIGAGIKYNIKMGYLMFDLRYDFSFMNMVNDEYRYDDIKYGNFGYIDDDFTLNNFYISFGYVYSFYKTKRQK